MMKYQAGTFVCPFNRKVCVAVKRGFYNIFPNHRPLATFTVQIPMPSILSSFKITCLLKNDLNPVISNGTGRLRNDRRKAIRQDEEPLSVSVPPNSQLKRRYQGIACGLLGFFDKVTSQHGPETSQIGPAKLNIKVESPPLIFYGKPHLSTGAILSGQLELDVRAAGVTLQSVEMVLLCVVDMKRPIVKKCAACKTRTNQIYKWTFLCEPSKYRNGTYEFPFTHLLHGGLPATIQSSLGTINYELFARARSIENGIINFHQPLTIQRALEGNSLRNCLRTFPPTNIIAAIAFPATIHTNQDFLIKIRISGVISQLTEHVQQRFCVQKISWRIEEHTSAIAPPCPKHAHKLDPLISEASSAHGNNDIGKLRRVCPREIGHGHLRRGWKTDDASSEIEANFLACLNSSLNPVCDIDSLSGLEVWHRLALVIVIAEEKVVGGNPELVSRTGKVRVLCTSFKVVVTERSGIGTSWDNEQPPVYENIGGGPPEYADRLMLEGPVFVSAGAR